MEGEFYLSWQSEPLHTVASFALARIVSDGFFSSPQDCQDDLLYWPLSPDDFFTGESVRVHSIDSLLLTFVVTNLCLAYLHIYIYIYIYI